jgi:hypothetical protein
MATSPDQPRVAAVMTVRDERDLLRKNLMYHRFLGVDTFYIYDDGSQDGTLETIADLPYVIARPSVAVSEVNLGADLESAGRQHDDHFVARQMLNSAHAMELARTAGCSWLIAFDADELMCVDRSKAEPGALRPFLAAQPDTIDVVTFLPLEALQRRTRYDDVMVEETLFKVGSAGSTRETYDPFEKRVHRIDAVYGHKAGKQAVRTTIPSIPYSVHRFRAPGGKKLRNVDQGDVLHYYAPDFDSFVHKFRTMHHHPDRHVDGRTVVIQKRLWRDVVNKSGMSDEELLDYYERWVMFNDEQVKQLRERRRSFFGSKPALVEVTSASEVLKSIQANDAGG